MERKANLKNQYTLLVLLILMKYSDAEHRITQDEIIHYLNSEYNVDAQPRSIIRALNALEDERLGFDLIRTKRGVALNERLFDEGEFEYIFDAICSSPSIPPKQVEKIVNDLTKVLSIHERQNYGKIEKLDCRGKLGNPRILYEIGMISNAIKSKSMIEFTYNQYTEDGKLAPLASNPRRIVPIKTFVREGRYLLLYANEERKIINDLSEPLLSRLFIDRMSGVIEIPFSKDEYPRVTEADIEEYLNAHHHLSDSPGVLAEIRIEDERVLCLFYSHFGESESVRKTVEGKSIITVQTDEDSLLSWCFLHNEAATLVSPSEEIAKLQQFSLSCLKNYKIKSNEETGIVTFSKLEPIFSFAPDFTDKTMSFHELFSNSVLQLPHFKERFRFKSESVSEFFDQFFGETGRSKKKHHLGKIFLFEIGEEGRKDLPLIGITPIPAYIIDGESRSILCLLLMWRIAYKGLMNSQGKARESFENKLREYWPDDFTLPQSFEGLDQDENGIFSIDDNWKSRHYGTAIIAIDREIDKDPNPILAKKRLALLENQVFFQVNITNFDNHIK